MHFVSTGGQSTPVSLRHALFAGPAADRREPAAECALACQECARHDGAGRPTRWRVCRASVATEPQLSSDTPLGNGKRVHFPEGSVT